MKHHTPRPETPEGPLISMADRLRDEVRRCEERLEAARLDLRNWLLSHPDG